MVRVLTERNRSSENSHQWRTFRTGQTNFFRRPDPDFDLSASVDPFQPYFPFSDHLSRQIIAALHNRYQSDEGSVQNTARARFLLAALHLYRGVSTTLPHTEQVTEYEGCVLLCPALTLAHHCQPVSSHLLSLSWLSEWRHNPNSHSGGRDLWLHKTYFHVLG